MKIQSIRYEFGGTYVVQVFYDWEQELRVRVYDFLPREDLLDEIVPCQAIEEFTIDDARKFLKKALDEENKKIDTSDENVDSFDI